jgi:hypothetical protein
MTFPEGDRSTSVKEYRQNVHRYSLLFWALLCTSTAVFCFVHSHHLISRRLRIEETLAGVLFLILGPAALTAYEVRSRLVWVSLSDDGLVISGGRTIPWEEIREVQRRRPLLRSSAGPARSPGFDPGDLASSTGGCMDIGCFSSLSEIFIVILLIVAVAFAVWVIAFVFIPLVIIPVLEVFVPFGDRIRIRTGRRTLLLRDLSDADEFVAAIGKHVRVSVG